MKTRALAGNPELSRDERGRGGAVPPRQLLIRMSSRPELRDGRYVGARAARRSSSVDVSVGGYDGKRSPACGGAWRTFAGDLFQLVIAVRRREQHGRRRPSARRGPAVAAPSPRGRAAQ